MVAFIEQGFQLPPETEAALADDLEVDFLPHGPGDSPARSMRGPEALLAGWREWLEPYESYVMELEDVVDPGGDDVILLAQVRARTRRDGVTMEHAPAARMTVSGDKVSRAYFFLDRAEAFE